MSVALVQLLDRLGYTLRPYQVLLGALAVLWLLALVLVLHAALTALLADPPAD